MVIYGSRPQDLYGQATAGTRYQPAGPRGSYRLPVLTQFIPAINCSPQTNHFFGSDSQCSLWVWKSRGRFFDDRSNLPFSKTCF